MKLLKKLFIKNYRNVNNPKVHHSYGIVAGIIGIICNIITFGIGIIIGLFSHSISIIVQSVATLSDAFSSIITLIGFKLASKPADKEHPYGHARVEYVCGLLVTIIMIVMGVIFTKSCFEKVISPEELSINVATYIILAIMILFKLFLMFMYNSFAKDIDSDTLKASSVDARNDMLANIAIFVSMIVMSIFKVNIDAYVGLAVSILVIYSAIRMFGETVDPLISVKPNKKLVSKIKRQLRSFETIIDMHDLLVHSYGTGSTFASVHIEVPDYITLLDCHELVDRIERHFEDELHINLTIQVDPVNEQSPENEKLCRKVERTLRTLNKNITVHGFRVIHRKKSVRLLFDILEDFNSNLTKKQIISTLQKAFDKKNNDNIKYEFVFTIDKPFT